MQRIIIFQYHSTVLFSLQIFLQCDTSSKKLIFLIIISQLKRTFLKSFILTTTLDQQIKQVFNYNFNYKISTNIPITNQSRRIEQKSYSPSIVMLFPSFISMLTVPNGSTLFQPTCLQSSLARWECELLFSPRCHFFPSPSFSPPPLLPLNIDIQRIDC